MKRRHFLVNLGTSAVAGVGLLNSVKAYSLPKKMAEGSYQYQTFLNQIYQQAIQQGMDRTLMKSALNLSVPNAKVIERDRKQPEFTMTWQEYYQKVITSVKIENGRTQFHKLQSLLAQLWRAYQVDMAVVLGIWGMESAYGNVTGKFNVIDSLATLAFEGRRAKFFKSELMNALKIINARDVSAHAMMGSYAGAMGQPQFMPSAYLRYAVDFSGTGKRNIWTDTADVLASIANYLGKCGWHTSEPWGQRIRIPESISQSMIGRTIIKTLGEWESLGVTRWGGQGFSRPDIKGAIIRPDGQGGEAFMVYHNFNVIRRYNPSDYYALGVGLLGDLITS